MKLFNFIFLLIFISCGGSREEPQKKLVVANSDMDNDGMSDSQEQEIGTHPNISDHPILLVQEIINSELKLDYNYQNKSNTLIVNSDKSNESLGYFEQASNYLFSDYDEISPVKASLSLELSIAQLHPYLQITEVSDLLLDIYFFHDGEQVFLVKDVFKKHQVLNEALTLDSMSVNPEALALLIYHRKSLSFKLTEFSYLHPVLEKNMLLSEQIKSWDKSTYQTIISDIYNISFFSNEITIEETIEYFFPVFDYNTFQLSHPKDANPLKQTIVDVKSHQFIQNDTRERVFDKSYSLTRNNGVVKQPASLRTTQDEYLVSFEKNKRMYSTVLRTLQFEIIRCSFQYRFHSSDQQDPVPFSELEGLISQSPQRFIKINEFQWIILSEQPIDWELASLTNNSITIGDINRSCKQHAHILPGYPGTAQDVIESKYKINIKAVKLFE